jgi:adenine/guanine phosphoribosyltransferase-like PRPP-binding protein
LRFHRARARVSAMDAPRHYRTAVGSQTLELPLVPLSDELTIALLICVDHGVAFAEAAGWELAALLAEFDPEIVVSVATMGIPLAIEVTRALGLDDYVILHKTPKTHLGESLAEPVRSITTGVPQKLRLDPARVPALEGRRVAVVDDVVSTGASTLAALNLVRRVGAQPVAIGALITEGSGWSDILGDDASRVRALGSIPVFRTVGGRLVEDWG